MVRDFPSALGEFEDALKNNSSLKIIKKKLIICYIQTGLVSKAFQLFQEVVKKDITLITNTDIQKDDCPCPEIIEHFSVVQLLNEDSLDFHLSLGMLWLYCDAEKSTASFEKALSLAGGTDLLNSISEIIITIGKFQKRRRVRWLSYFYWILL